MAFPKKTKLPIALTDRSTIDLSCQHITTSDFMTLNVAKALELVPKQSVDVNLTTFARLEPLPVPTFGRAKIKNRAYFVPYRTIWTGWNDFITDTPHVYDGGTLEQLSEVPVFLISDLTIMFIHPDYPIFSEQVNEGESFDFEYAFYNPTSSLAPSSTSKYKFTNLGRQVYKLLRSLGYSVDFTNRTGYVSALPLLSLCRVYYDYIYPSQYSNDADSAWLASFFINNTDPRDLAEPYIFSATDLKRIFRILVKIPYEPDYFTSAWDNPNAPNSNLASTITINDIDSNTEGADYENIIGYNNELGESAPFITNPSNGSLNNLSQFALNALRSMSDYLKRHQIVGSKVIDRYLARFGVKLSAEKLNRSIFVGESIQDIQFGDIMSTADTDGASLGSFAGRGISAGQGNFSFSTDEYGMLIFISTIVPLTQYYQGENRHCSHISKLDFFTPEFDNLGTQAIACTELYAVEGPNTITNYRSRVFGFTPRYAEYKVPYSQITGDYVVKSLNTGKDAWTLFRDVEPIYEIGGAPQHDLSFVMSGDSDQYNRIFYNTASNADHFNIIHDFNIKSSFPGKSLFDTYEFKDEDKAQKVTVDLGGSSHT